MSRMSVLLFGCVWCLRHKAISLKILININGLVRNNKWTHTASKMWWSNLNMHWQSSKSRTLGNMHRTRRDRLIERTSYYRLKIYEEYTERSVIIGISCICFSPADIYIVWLLQNALPIALSAAAMRGKITNLALNSWWKRSIVWSFSAVFCAHCKDLSTLDP